MPPNVPIRRRGPRGAPAAAIVIACVVLAASGVRAQQAPSYYDRSQVWSAPAAPPAGPHFWGEQPVAQQPAPRPPARPDSPPQHPAPQWLAQPHPSQGQRGPQHPVRPAQHFEAVGQPPVGQPPAGPGLPGQPARRVPASQLIPPERPGDHPLARAVGWAKIGLAEIEKIEDYSATVVKRERHGAKLNDYEYFFLKIRHNPFSVYLYFLSPQSVRGQEVIYVEGQNNGNMWAHTVGVRDALIGTVSLSPTGLIAMRGQRYPLTEIGLLNMTRRLVEVGEQDMQYGECEVQFFVGAKVNDRVCTCLQVVHPVPRRNFLFHIARIFVDEEFNVPIRYESWDWPKREGEAPELLEEYTYLNLKLNNGFTDMDFDIRNPNYKFR
jgi:hypothetical protein